MKKSHEKHHGPGHSAVATLEAESLGQVVERTSGAKKCRTGRHKSFVVYEEGDLRGILSKALTELSEPYRVLLESGVIKNAAEFIKE